MEMIEIRHMEGLLRQETALPNDARQPLVAEAYEHSKQMLLAGGMAVGIGAFMGRGAGIASLFRRGSTIATEELGIGASALGKLAERLPSAQKLPSTFEIIQSRGLLKNSPKVAVDHTATPTSNWKILENTHQEALFARGEKAQTQATQAESVAKTNKDSAVGNQTQTLEFQSSENLGRSNSSSSFLDAINRSKHLANIEVPPSLSAATHGISFGNRQGLASPVFATAEAAREAGTDFGFIINRKLHGSTGGAWQSMPEIGIAKLDTGYSPVIDAGIGKGLLMLDHAGRAISIRTENGALVELKNKTRRKIHPLL